MSLRKAMTDHQMDDIAKAVASDLNVKLNLTLEMVQLVYKVYPHMGTVKTLSPSYKLTEDTREHLITLLLEIQSFISTIEKKK